MLKESQRLSKVFQGRELALLSQGITHLLLCATCTTQADPEPASDLPSHVMMCTECLKAVHLKTNSKVRKVVVA